MQNTLKIDGITLRYSDAEFTFFNVKLMEIYEKEPLNNSALHSHKHYELHFVTRGQYSFSSVNGNETVKAGEFIIFPPEYKHYSAMVDEAYDSIVIQFQVENKSSKSDFYNYFTSSLDISGFKAVIASKELMDIVKDFQNKSSLLSGIEAFCLKQSILSEFIYRLFYDINRFCLDGEKAKCSETRSDFLILLDHMITSNTYSLNDIAERTGYSTRNISRIVLSIYKMSLSEIKRKNSIDTAKKLLVSRDNSIEEIAVLSGFKNASAMRNAFRKYEGTTPTDYKNEMTAKEIKNENQSN